MVATKSRKAKFTYTERVLGAFSLLQKEHRRRSVHLASLRAQVRKTAQAKKDTLGPQWSSWVGKAVHKLEDEGLLVSEPAGIVTVTPNGKKAISAARRNLSISAHATPSRAQEEQIWKEVTQSLAGRGLKRKKFSRYADEGNEDNDEEQEEGVPSTLRTPNTRSKRTRFSSIGQKPVSKMNKTELTAELKSLQRAHAQTVASLQRSQQVETDGSDAEEVSRLRDELKQRQVEIDTVRDELAQFRRLAASGDETSTQHNGASSPGPTDFLSSSPIRNVANVPARTRPLTGITRTQSGSHIPHLSKQPTPAPSSPGITDHDGDFTFDADGDMLGHADGTDDVFVGTSGGNGGGMRDSSLLSVLETTSGRAMRELRLEEELGRYKTLVEEMKAQAEERDALSRDKLVSLEQALASRTNELQSLEKSASTFRDEHSECQPFLSQRDTRITALQAEVQNLQHKDSLISLKDDQIAELDLARTTAEKAFASEKSELEAIIEERNSSIALLLSEKENNLSHLSVLRRDSEATIREHLSRIEATDSRVLSLLSTVVEKDEQLVAERASNAALSGERLALETQLVKQKETALASSKQIEAQNARIAELEEHIEASKASKDTIARELAQMVNQNSSLVELLHVTEASNASLEIQIANANNQKYEVDATLAEARVSIDDLHVQLQAETGALASSKSAQFDLQNQLSQSQRYAQDLRKQISTSDISVEQLRVTVESSKATNEQLSSELQSAIEHGTKLSSTLEEKEQKINELVAWKESTGKDITSWQKEVAKTKELAVALGEEVGATTVLLTSSRRETDGVRKDLEAKESQREELARMLSALETVGDDLRTEVADGKKEIHRLQLALDHAEDRVQDLQVTLRAMDEDIRATTADSDSTISVLQNTLVTAQSDIDALNNKMNTLVASYSRVRAELEEKHADLAQTQDALESAKTRVVALEQDMEELVVRAQDAEEEVLDLKSAQEADAMTIESFKEGFAKLRKMQMQSLAELDNKVVSAQSSPVHKARRPPKTPARTSA